MHSTLTGRDADPHDLFVIEPDVVLAARTDRATSNPAPEIQSGFEIIQVRPVDEIIEVCPVDTKFRATAVDDIVAEGRPRTNKFARQTFMALFAACGAIGAAAWQHYGDTAKDMIADWMSPSAVTSSPAPSSLQAENPIRTEPQPSPVQVDTSSQLAAQAPSPPLTAEAVAAEAAQLPSLGRDVATMRQEIEQLKATIEQLRAAQGQPSRDVARNSQTSYGATGPSDRRLRPKLSVPAQSASLPARKPRPAYAPSSTASVLTPAPPFPQGAAPPPPAEAQARAFAPSDGGPVLRPPMPVR